MNLHVGAIGSLAAFVLAGPPSCWPDAAGRAGAGLEVSAPPDASAGAAGGCAEEAPACEPGSCPAGTRCLADGCGGRRCQPAGLPCLDAADCPAGGTCFDGPLGSVCLAPPEGCVDARECPTGYACEHGACVDHRVDCTSDADCPADSYCARRVTYGAPHCQRVDRLCAHHAACPVGSLCLAPDAGPARCAFDVR